MGEISFGLPINKTSFGMLGFPTGFCKEANAIIRKMDSVGTATPEAEKVRINNVIINLKAKGIWDELDALPVLSGHSRGAGLIDWKAPNDRTLTVYNAYSGDFVANSYFKGNGSNFRIDTGFNPGDGGAYKFNKYSNSFGYYAVDHVDETKVDVSALNAGSVGNECVSIVTSFSLNGKNAFGTARSVANFTNTGLFVCKRTGAKAWELQKNGYDMYSGGAKETDTGTTVANRTFKLFCRDVDGTYSQFSTKKIAYFFAGSGNFDVFELHNTMDRYYLNPKGITPTKRIIFNGNSFTANGTYQKQVMSDLGSYNYDVLSRGISGQTTVEMLKDAYASVFNKSKTFLSKDVIFVWELTNDMAANSSNATTCYNNLVTYLQALKSYLPTAKIVVATMLPRSAASITNANRQNDANLTDDTTLNGKIRNHLVADGYCDAICDVASDATMGIYSNGVAGVGEKNTTYYNVDEIHPNTTGYNYLATNYIKPSINTYL